MVAKGVCPECGQALAEGFSPVLNRAREEFEARKTEHAKTEKAASKAAARPVVVEKAEKEATAGKVKLEETRKLRDAAALGHEQARVLQRERTAKAEQSAKLEASLSNTPAIYDAKKHAAVSKQMEALDPEHLRFLALQGCDKVIEDRERDHKKATKDLETAHARYKAIETERATLGFANPNAADEAITVYRALDRELQDVQANLRSIKSVQEYAQAAVNQAISRIEEHHIRAKELAEARNGAAAYDVLAKELRNLRERLNRSIRPDLEARASENLNLLTNGRYSTIALDNDFDATVVEDGISKQVISGGEEDVVALSLRLALSELIQERNGRPMTLLILDEVFGSLDTERRQSVLDRLASMKGRFHQILVISHIEEINQVADQALYLVRDPDTRATVVTDAPPDAAAMLL
jgi:exonuclease SbcC